MRYWESGNFKTGASAEDRDVILRAPFEKGDRDGTHRNEVRAKRSDIKPHCLRHGESVFVPAVVSIRFRDAAADTCQNQKTVIA